MEIRDFTKEYIEGAVQVERLCFEDPWTKEMFESELKNERANYSVLLDGETVAGYAGFWKIGDEAHIMNIAVKPEYRRKHFAEMLMEDMIKRAKALFIRNMTLEVRKSNAAAISLYEKYGFKEAGVRKKYYDNNREDAIIMWNEI